MTINLPRAVLYILHRLQQADFEAFLVGGAVRDLMLGQTEIAAVDYDFTTNATPATIQRLFPESFYENKFGTVSITPSNLQTMMEENYQLLGEVKANPNKPSLQTQSLVDLQRAKKIHHSLRQAASTAAQPSLIESGEEQAESPLEITTYRSDGLYLDHRRPSEVSFGQSISDDLQRRDFTINAMAIRVKQQFLKQVFAKQQLAANFLLTENDYQLIDEHQGQTDLRKRLLRTVGQASARFAEDALRMLRAVRLAVQLDMDIDTETYFAIKEHHDKLKFVSFERIRDELLKILGSAKPARGIELLDQLKLLDKIIPELAAGKAMQQRGHHISDVWTHSLDALRYCPSPDPIVRLATLLHDIGKPLTYQEQHGEITFYNHDVLGARIASKIAQRLRLPKKDTQRIFILVRYHMFHYQPEHTDASIRRFMKRVGLENIDDILDLREGDRLGSGAKKTSWRLEEMKQRIIEQLNQPMGLDDLIINGHDLMQELKLKPGPVLGQILDKLLEKVLENPELNERESLLEEAREVLKNKD